MTKPVDADANNRIVAVTLDEEPGTAGRRSIAIWVPIVWESWLAISPSTASVRGACEGSAPMSCGMSLVSRAFWAVRSLATRLHRWHTSVCPTQLGEPVTRMGRPQCLHVLR